jgi:hypothetical protein
MSKLELISYNIIDEKIKAEIYSLSIEDENEITISFSPKSFIKWLDQKAFISDFRENEVLIEYLNQTCDHEGEYKEDNFEEWVDIEIFLQMDNNQNLLEEFLNEKI